MISSKRLAQMASKWLQRAAAAGRKRIAFRTAGGAAATVTAAAPAAARKGRFVVYSSDGQRFELPLAYLQSAVVVELLRMSEEAFGLPAAGPITLPWDAAAVSSAVSCLQKPSSSRDVAESAIHASMAARSCIRCSRSVLEINKQLEACGAC